MKYLRKGTRRLFGHSRRFLFSAKTVYLSAVVAVILQPLASLAIPAQPTNLEASGNPNQPTLSWNAASNSETTGVDWIERSGSSARWSQRFGHGATVFDDKMWILGGSGTNGRLNDVWSSTDGITWTEVTSAAAWSARQEPASVVFNNKIWVIGGSSTDGRLNDVWSSTDGITWTEETASAGWFARSGHAATVFDDKLWVFGGADDNGLAINDVWSSTDGITWTEETSNAAWSNRGFHNVVVFDNKLWVIGGSDESYNIFSDVWYSSDGSSWSLANGETPWRPRLGHATVVLDGRLWVMGGTSLMGEDYSDVWASSDGVTWSEVTSSAGWSADMGFTSVAFDGRLWVLGGYSLMTSLYYNDVWSTTDSSISHYRLCWDTVQGGCRNTAVSTSTSYALNQPLSPGTWYFSVIAVNGQGEESVLGASTELTVPTVALYPLSGKGQTYRLDDTIYATDSTASAPVEDSVTTPEITSPTNDEKDSTDDEQDGSTLPLALAIIAVILATGWLIFRYSLKRRG